MLVLLLCSLPVVASLAPLPHEGVKLSKAQLRFSTEMFQKMAARDYKNNVVFSPYSVYSSLLILYLASALDTRKLLQNVLRFNKFALPDPAYISHNFFHEIPSNRTEPYELDSYDRIYVIPTNRVKSNAGKMIEEKDFVCKTQHALEDDINDWVSLYTKEIITCLLKKGSIAKDALFVIVNAAYFKGYWTAPFSGEKKKKPFTLSDGTVTQTLFMAVQYVPFKSMTDHELKAQVISLPYKGDNISMIIILPTTRPKKKASPPIADVVKKLTHTAFHKMEAALQATQMRTVDLLIPKFKLEGTHELRPVFEALGDKALFTKNLFLPAYFKKGQHAKISRIVHKVHVNVLEVGSETAAAEATVGVRAAVTTTFHADHPFVYIIYDQAERFIHFIGILNKP